MNRVLATIFYAVLGLYIVFLLCNPQFAPAEEPTMFLTTIQAGKFYPPYISFSEARFYPLHAQEYNLVSRILPANPFSYYCFNALQLVIFFIAFKKVLEFATKNKSLIYSSLLLLLLSPGLANVWFRMIVPERGVIFWGILFLYFYFVYVEVQENTSKLKNFFLVSLILLCVNLSIYHKEPVSLSVGAFAICHFSFLYSKRVPHSKLRRAFIADISLVLSSIIFLSIYFFYIYLGRTGSYITDVTDSGFINGLKNFIAYLFIDPVLIFGLALLAIWRILSVIKRHQSAHPIYDSMLIAAIVYISAIFMLNLRATYYLLPAYIFAIPAFVFFLTHLQSKMNQGETKLLKGWSSALLIAIFLQVTSAIPLTLETISDYKYMPINVNLTADFIVKEINNSKGSNYSPSIFLIGIKEGQEFLFEDFANLLEYRGLKKQQYQMNLHSFEEAKQGDYLVISPFSELAQETFPPSNLEKQVSMVYRTESKWAFPNYGLERVLKYFLIKILPEEQSNKIFVAQTKLFEPLVDYLVFIHK